MSNKRAPGPPSPPSMAVSTPQPLYGDWAKRKTNLTGGGNTSVSNAEATKRGTYGSGEKGEGLRAELEAERAKVERAKATRLMWSIQAVEAKEREYVIVIFSYWKAR